MPYFGTSVSHNIDNRNLMVTIKIHGPLDHISTVTSFAQLKQFVKEKLSAVPNGTLAGVGNYLAEAIKEEFLNGKDMLWVDVCVDNGLNFYGAIAEKVLASSA